MKDICPGICKTLAYQNMTNGENPFDYDKAISSVFNEYSSFSNFKDIMDDVASTVYLNCLPKNLNLADYDLPTRILDSLGNITMSNESIKNYCDRLYESNNPTILASGAIVCLGRSYSETKAPINDYAHYFAGYLILNDKLNRVLNHRP